IARRTIARRLPQLADLVNAAVSGRVNLDDIHGISRANFSARLANAARLDHGLIRRTAIQRHGQNARDRGFANAPVPAENVSMRRSSLLNRILQRAGNVFLPDDFGEFLRTVFAGQDLIAHGEEIIRLYVMRGARRSRPETVAPMIRLRNSPRRDTLSEPELVAGLPA